MSDTLNELDREAIRRMLGWDEKMDPANIDKLIDRMNGSERARLWAQWQLGNRSIADGIIRVYKSAPS